MCVPHAEKSKKVVKSMPVLILWRRWMPHTPFTDTGRRIFGPFQQTGQCQLIRLHQNVHISSKTVQWPTCLPVRSEHREGAQTVLPG